MYDRVDQSEIKRTGCKLIGAGWVDVDKGNSINVDCRSHVVGREVYIGRDDVVYSATPPLDALRIIISHEATTREDGCRKEVMINDFRKACLRKDRLRRLRRTTS